MNALLLGIIFGLPISISFGPGFVALFQTSLERGVRSGIIVATGMLFSDLSLVMISYFGFAALLIQGEARTLGIITGLILIGMGLFNLFKASSTDLNVSESVNLQGNIMTLLGKGFLLNIANPFSLIFWIGVVGVAGRNWNLYDYHVLLFFTGLFLTAFTSDIVKCYLSGKLRNLLANGTILTINRLIGAVFILIGFVIMFRIR